MPSGLRSSPTGRVPQWVIDEAAGRVPPSGSWRSWAPAEPRRSARRRRRWSGVSAAALVVAVLGLGVMGSHLGVLPGAPATAATPSGSRSGWPSPSAEEADEPLGTPVPAAVGAGAYGFVHHQDDGVTPVAYDPCRPIHYVIRQDNAPRGGDQLVADAVARVSAATGLRFVYDGTTDEAPSDEREPFQPDRYGDRWAPVLVAWDTVTEQPDLAADVAGLGGSQSVSVGGGPAVFVTGTVELDAAEFGDLLSWPDGASVARAIVLHEFGHVVGLQHVDDPAQLMYPTTSAVLDFAGGDLAGLAQLGSGECVPEL